MRKIPERDWKQIRKIKDNVLAAVCEEIFKKVDKLSKKRNGREHEAYLELWKTIKKEDRKIADMFDELKRSNAFFKLANWRHYGFLSDEDFSNFSVETQQVIELMLQD